MKYKREENVPNFECRKKFHRNSRRKHLMNLKISRCILFRLRTIPSRQKDEVIQCRSPCINRAGQQAFSDIALPNIRTNGLDILNMELCPASCCYCCCFRWCPYSLRSVLHQETDSSFPAPRFPLRLLNMKSINQTFKPFKILIDTKLQYGLYFHLKCRRRVFVPPSGINPVKYQFRQGSSA